MRPRGREELARELIARGFERGAVSLALDRLAREGWQDELGAARSTVRLRSERYGVRRIEQELKSRGFSRETIDAALSDRDLEREEKTLRRAVEKAWTRYSRLSPTERRRRAIESLARRGFAAEKVSEMIEDLSHGERNEVRRGPRALS